MNLKFGREVCGDRKIAESREWLVTNGIGGYASGTISGVLTRKYHGLLVAALDPPVERTLLLTKLDETVTYNRQDYHLNTDAWLDGTVAPQGYLNLESFYLKGTIPVWNFAFADGLLEKQVWMQHKANTTYIRYQLLRGSQPVTLSLKALVNYRNHHGNTHVTDSLAAYKISSLSSLKTNNSSDNIPSLEVKASAEATSLYLSAISHNKTNEFNWKIENIWYRNYALAVEKYRGLDSVEDHCLAATGEITLNRGDSITIVATTENKFQLDSEISLQQAVKRESKLIDFWRISNFKFTNLSSGSPDSWIEQLVLAADRFIVERPLENNPQGKTIIAGYPWFTDWGRDTAIALPGLTIAVGRYEVAKNILLTFARYIDRGMLPNVFPDVGETPAYNTADATLWYFEAIRAYYEATEDREFLQQLFPALADIIDWHLKGTRYNIKMDDDGLLYAGESGVQLTWMDAKVDDWVVTPRIGKPVEINALWYNALVSMVHFAGVLEQSDSQYQELASHTRSHFSKFWYDEGGYCYDVIDSPEGNDSSFRPNQIFAVSLPAMSLSTNSLLQPEQQKMVVDKVAQRLLTSYGLRSLSTDDSNYVGIYGGDRWKRDGGYHQGTVWSWLIGHFVQAHLRVYKNPQIARSFLLPMISHLRNGCVGNISEIFDGNAPFTPRGCFAQAWSVAEAIRAWNSIS